MGHGEEEQRPALSVNPKPAMKKPGLSRVSSLLEQEDSVTSAGGLVGHALDVRFLVGVLFLRCFDVMSGRSSRGSEGASGKASSDQESQQFMHDEKDCWCWKG
jgi:hypothetical protein